MRERTSNSWEQSRRSSAHGLEIGGHLFAVALVDVAMKGVQFSAIDEIGVDQSVNGMAIAVASLIGFNLPDVALHPIFGAILDKYEPAAAYKIIFACLLGLLVVGFIMSLVLYTMKKEEDAVAASKT